MKTNAILAAALLISCVPVTVNISFQFPDEEMGKKLYDMEKGVRDQASREKPQSFIPVDGANALILNADDPKIDINVNTPAIRAINDRRAKRHPGLKPHFAAGRIGEGNDASVKVRNEEGISGKEKADFKNMVREENDDRTALLKEILKANKLGEEHLARLRKLYADTLHKLAEKGWWIETETGWKQKE